MIILRRDTNQVKVMMLLHNQKKLRKKRQEHTVNGLRFRPYDNPKLGSRNGMTMTK